MLDLRPADPMDPDQMMVIIATLEALGALNSLFRISGEGRGMVLNSGQMISMC